MDGRRGKHQRTYADSLNRQLAGNEQLGAALAKGGLEGLVAAAWNSGKPVPAFNNAAQVYNHQLFWASMKPGGGGAPQVRTRASMSGVPPAAAATAAGAETCHDD